MFIKRIKYNFQFIEKATEIATWSPINTKNNYLLFLDIKLNGYYFYYLVPCYILAD